MGEEPIRVHSPLFVAITWSCRSSPEAKDADAPKCRSPVNGEKSFSLEVSGIGPGGPLHRQTAPLPGDRRGQAAIATTLSGAMARNKPMTLSVSIFIRRSYEARLRSDAGRGF